MQIGVTVGKRTSWVKVINFSDHEILKFDGWPRKTKGHLFKFNATSNFVHHFEAICEFSLETHNSDQNWLFLVLCELALWPLTLPFCIDNQIISHSCNYSWKCHDYMTWTLWTRCSENYNTPQQAGTKPYLVAKILATKIGNLWASVAVNYQYSRYKIDMTSSIDNQYGFHNIDI